MTLLKEQRTEDVADRLHLAPRFVVREVEREVHATAQFIEGGGEVVGFAGGLGEELAAVLDLRFQDGRVDVEDGGAVARILVHHVVVHDATGERRVLQGFLEQDLLGLGLGHHALGGVGHTACVVLGGDGGREDVLVGVHRLGEDLIPLAEADHHVPRHRDVGLQEDGAHWDDAGEHELHTVVGVARGQRVDRLAGVLQRRLVLAVEHGAPDDEVVVVHAVEFVELRFVAGDAHVVVVGLDRGNVALDGFLPLSDPCVDVRGHVDEVAEAGHARAEHVGRGQGALWEGRKLEGVAVQVAERGVDASSLARFESVLHDLDQQQGVVVRRRDLARGGVLVPQLPRLEVHQRLHVDGGDREVAGVLLVQRSHRLGEGHVEFGQVAHVEDGRVSAVTGFLRVTGGQGADEVLLDLAAVVHDLEGLLDGVVTRAKAWSPVVVGGQAVGDAPPCHRTVGVRFGAGHETGNRLLVVVVQVVAVAFHEQLQGFFVGAGDGCGEGVI